MKTIDWIIFLLLAIFAIQSSGDAWDNYKKKSTAMMSEVEEITAHPTVTMCLGYTRHWNNVWYEFKTQLHYGIDFNILYYTSSDRLMTYQETMELV